MAKNTRANGNLLYWVYVFAQLGIRKRTKETDWVFSCGQMGRSMKVCGKMAGHAVKEG